MISARYAPAVLVLVVLALVPTLIHSYAGVVVSDGRRTTSVPTSLAGFTSRISDRNATWGQRRFESDDWMERVYATPRGETTLTVVRSFDLKALYHHPELAIAYGADFANHTVENVGARTVVPVHVLRTEGESTSLAVYALHYDDAFVRDPIWFQIRTAGELLFGGRRAMTLFFAQTSTASSDADLSKEPAVAILLAAVDSFVDEAPPQSASSRR